jgi:hypothetical protein
MFADIEADVFIMVDGDDTYDAASARGWFNCWWTESLIWSTASASRRMPTLTVAATDSELDADDPGGKDIWHALPRHVIRLSRDVADWSSFQRCPPDLP